MEVFPRDEQFGTMFWQLSALLAVICRASSAANPIVDTPLGKVQGWELISRDGRTYQAFTRLPYAQPPLGSLRLKAPKPVDKWEGLLNATRELPLCYQRTGGQEDCLYLNVFRPKIDKKNLPVLVFVHGGGFAVGNIQRPQSADFLMDEDVVLVTVHYRLNGFGFMTMGDSIMPGNFGLKDQVMALRWIKQNIAAFSGNPESVTVFGNSAGGASTNYLLKSPLTEDLVSRASSDSGTINHLWSLRRVDYVKSHTLAVAEELNCTMGMASESILECLQKVDAETLMGAINRQYATDDEPVQLPFAPVIEPKDAEEAFVTEDLSIRASTKPWITSVTNGEYTLFLNKLQSQPAEKFERLTRNLTEYLKNWIDYYRTDVSPDFIKYSRAKLLESIYFKQSSLENRTVQFSKMHADSWFTYPAIHNLDYHHGPTWFYHLDYHWQHSRSKAPNVSGHAEQDVFYMNYLPTRMTDADYDVSKRMIKYLVNFAYYDNPTPKGSSLEWKQFEDKEILRITADGDAMCDMEFAKEVATVSNNFVFTIDWM